MSSSSSHYGIPHEFTTRPWSQGGRGWAAKALARASRQARLSESVRPNHASGEGAASPAQVLACSLPLLACAPSAHLTDRQGFNPAELRLTTQPSDVPVGHLRPGIANHLSYISGVMSADFYWVCDTEVRELPECALLYARLAEMRTVSPGRGASQ